MHRRQRLRVQVQLVVLAEWAVHRPMALAVLAVLAGHRRHLLQVQVQLVALAASVERASMPVKAELVEVRARPRRVADLSPLQAAREVAAGQELVAQE